MAFHLSRDVLEKIAPGEEGGRNPMSSAATWRSCATSATTLTAQTACTINVHEAGDNGGYVAYGVERVRALKDSLRANPYQKVKVQPHASAGEKAEVVGDSLLSKLGRLLGFASPRVSVSPSTDIPESPLPASEFGDAVTESELHREESVLVERCRCKNRRLVFKKYFSSTMPTHESLHDQLVYELNLYYKDLKGLRNVIQIESHFYDSLRNLTFVFPDLGPNIYPVDRSGIISYMRQLLVALDHLWHRGVIHCNIKGGLKPNAIFDRNGKLTLIDFESAIRRHELIDQGQNLTTYETLNYRGNPFYVAPEVVEAQPGYNLYGNTRFGRRRDVFSAGVVFAELLLDVDHLFTYPHRTVFDPQIRKVHRALKHRLSANSPVDALCCYGDFLLEDDAFLNLNGADLVVKMLMWDRFQRPAPGELLRHQVFGI
ncbi:unnamed protein product [Durusdinium trenchii]|uniref:Uncharacterized protein n=2 Tax=Durusdinium trenchii TaxID=1381693 RepID=A0ABP0P9W9_9DINO